MSESDIIEKIWESFTEDEPGPAVMGPHLKVDILFREAAKLNKIIDASRKEKLKNDCWMHPDDRWNLLRCESEAFEWAGVLDSRGYAIMVGDELALVDPEGNFDKLTTRVNKEEGRYVMPDGGEISQWLEVGHWKLYICIDGVFPNDS